MNWLAGVVGAIFVIGIITGICRGAIRITVSLATTIVTLVLVFFATPLVSDGIVRFTPMDDVIEEKVASAIVDAAASQLSGGGTDGEEAGGLTEERVEKVLKAAGISESTLEQYGISISDIVNGKISSQDLATYGISSNLLDGLNNHEGADGSEGTSVEDIINNAEIPRDIQMAAIENADMPQIFKDLLRENNNSEMYKSLGVNTFAQYVGKFLAKIVIHIVAFLVTFLLVTIILRAVIFALDFVADLPGIGFVNRLAGGMIGCIGAAIVVWVMFVVITLLYTTSVGKNLYDTIQSQPYLYALYEYNPIMKLATILK